MGKNDATEAAPADAGHGVVSEVLGVLDEQTAAVVNAVLPKLLDHVSGLLDEAHRRIDALNEQVAASHPNTVAGEIDAIKTAMRSQGGFRI